MYGGSIIGRILGYKYTRGVAARMRAVRQAMLPEDGAEVREVPEYNSRFYVTPWPPVAILAVTELVAVLALTTR